MPKIPQRFWPLIILFAVLVIFMPRAAKFNYDYRKGTPWPYETLVAQFDFPILKTEEQMNEEAENLRGGVIPYYRFSIEAVGNTIKAVEGLDLGKYSYMRPDILSLMSDIYSKGVVSDAAPKLDLREELSSEQIYIQKGKRVKKYPLTEVYKVSAAKADLLSHLADKHTKLNCDSLLERSGAYDLMVPNLIFDKTTTELVHSESDNYVSPFLGYVQSETKIVSKDEIITSEIAQMLDSYKAEYNKIYGYEGPKILIILGNILLALALAAILYFTILYTNPAIFSDWNRYLYLLTVIVIAWFTTFAFLPFKAVYFYMIPFPVTALYLRDFFKNRVVLPVYFLSLLPLLIFAGNGTELFVMYLAAGVVSIYTFSYFGKGWKQFVNALIVFAVCVIVYFGFRLIDAASVNVGLTVLYIFLGSMFSVALYPLIYLFEKIFGLVSNTKLIELTDTNNPLVRTLAQKAPGTFQHSLQVMAMCDAAARVVDANVARVRAGALYHDIGKMTNPLCFVENESVISGSRSYHDNLTPEQSAAKIIAHVADGVRIAQTHGLPSMLIDFIKTHHGSSLVGFFYSKHLSEGGSEADAPKFCYPGPNPTTTEQVILMICDSVEAASRTLKENSPEAYSELVENIVNGKIKSGLLENSDISIRDLNKIKAELKTYLAQIYHERVEYPKN